MRRSTWLSSLCRALVAGVLVPACATAALAQAPRLDLSLPANGADVAERLAFLEERLEAAQPHGRVWHYGWLGTYALGLALNSARAAVTDDDDARVAAVVTAGKSVIGLTSILLHPLPARLGADPIRALPGGTPERELVRLRAAERLLEASAERTRLKSTPEPHLTNALINLTAGGLILAFGNWQGAAISTGLGLAFGEARIMTVPNRPAADLAAYRGRFGGPATAADDAGWYLAPRADGAGIAVGLRF